MKKPAFVFFLLLAIGSLSADDLELTSPREGERWTFGTVQNITWSVDGARGRVNLALRMSDGTTRMIAQNIAARSGSYAWTVGSVQGGTVVSGAGHLVLLQAMDGTVQATSGAFTIVPSRVRPTGQAVSKSTITVASPNGRESWKAGETRPVKWYESELSESVRISLLKDEAEIGLIADNIPRGQRTFSWRVGDPLIGGRTYEAGAGFKIKVMARSGSPADTSNGSFSIAAVPVATVSGGPSQVLSIQVVYPNGGEHLYSGQTIVVKYRTTGSIDRITTRLNQLTPQPFQRNMNVNVPNTGQFSYLIPNVGEGGDFKVKIYGHVSGDTRVEDVSNGPFKIYKGLDLVASRAELKLKAEYGDRTTKEWLFFFTSPVGTAVELIDMLRAQALLLTLKFRVTNEGRYWPEPELKVNWAANIHKDGVHFMAKNGTVSLSEFRNSAEVETVFRMGTDVRGLLKIEVIIDGAHVLPEADFFRRNNTLTQSISLVSR